MKSNACFKREKKYLLTMANIACERHNCLEQFYYLQCPEKRCQAGGSKVHTLGKKSERLCLHKYLVLKSGLYVQSSDDSVSAAHEIDRNATVEEVVKRIRNHLPTATSDSQKFLANNKKFIEDLCKKKDINAELAKFLDEQCQVCNEKLSPWGHKTKESYLLTMGELKKVKSDVRFCKKCKTLSYYNLYEKGLVPLHNKVKFRFQLK